MPKKSASKRGRPPFKPTEALRRQVAVSAGAGTRHESIAIALGISVDTLRKYFETELAVGAAKRRMDVVGALYRSAMKGSTSAARAYLALEPQIAAPPHEGDPAVPPAPDVPPRARKAGKKEQAAADAVTAQVGTDWDTLLPAPTAKQ